MVYVSVGLWVSGLYGSMALWSMVYGNLEMDIDGSGSMHRVSSGNRLAASGAGPLGRVCGPLEPP